MRQLERFILAPKPDWCGPVDVSVMVYLISSADGTSICSPTKAQIIAAVGVSEKNTATINRCLMRLSEHGWVEIIPGNRIGVTTTYHIRFDRLPGFEVHP